MSPFLNITSLCLGLISWIIPIVYLSKPHSISVPCASFLCCSLSLLLQLAEVRHRLYIGDVSAVMDTINAVVFAGTVMLCVCVLLNLCAFLKGRK